MYQFISYKSTQVHSYVLNYVLDHLLWYKLILSSLLNQASSSWRPALACSLELLLSMKSMCVMCVWLAIDKRQWNDKFNISYLINAIPEEVFHTHTHTVNFSHCWPNIKIGLDRVKWGRVKLIFCMKHLAKCIYKSHISDWYAKHGKSWNWMPK